MIHFQPKTPTRRETFELYISTLRQLVKSCNYCNTCLDSLIQDGIVLGIRDTNTQPALLKERNLTLEQAIDIYRAAENATAHLQALHPTPERVNKLKGHPHRRQRQKKDSNTRQCIWCGEEHARLNEPMPCIWENLLSMSATKPLRKNVPPEKVSGKYKTPVHHLQDESDETSSGEEFIDTIATHARGHMATPKT